MCVLAQVPFGSVIAFVFSVKWDVSYLVEREKGSKGSGRHTGKECSELGKHGVRLPGR